MRTALTFAVQAVRYWLIVFPRCRRELCRWRRRASQIPDRALRQLALQALEKRENMEGAAAFASAVRWRRRGAVVRALVAFQAAYNHVDMLAEQPGGDSARHAQVLHESLIAALDPDAVWPDGAPSKPRWDDGGYLAEMIDACREAVCVLPSYALIAEPAHRAASRIVAFQSLSLDRRDVLERWAHTLLPAASELEWWESAAAAGSSLGVHALIAAAAEPSLRAEDVAAIEGAYLHWIGALHSLLDSLIDQAEDLITGQASLIGFYSSPQEAKARMRWLAERAVDVARRLPRGRQHAALVVAMSCSYLCVAEADAPGAFEIARGVREALDPTARPALLIFRARRLAGRLVCGHARIAAVEHAPPAGSLATRKRGAGARAA